MHPPAPLENDIIQIHLILLNFQIYLISYSVPNLLTENSQHQQQGRGLTVYGRGYDFYRLLGTAHPYHEQSDEQLFTYCHSLSSKGAMVLSN